jgi:hypothetical protein
MYHCCKLLDLIEVGQTVEKLFLLQLCYLMFIA